MAASITDLERRADVLTAVADAAAASGDFDRAEAVAASITDLERRADVLTAVADAAAAGGDFDRAEAVAANIIDWSGLCADRGGRRGRRQR